MATEASDADLASYFLHIAADHGVVLHIPEEGEGASLSGIDLDCAVVGLDLQWPLRLSDGWRLCQCLHYDLRGWCWVLEKDGRIVAFDTVEDPLGLGRDALPTASFVDLVGEEISSGARAAYLTAKRLRKGMLDEAEWRRIGNLAQSDAVAYRRALDAILGARVTRLIEPYALAGRAPERRVWRRARVLQLARRVRTPGRALTAVWLGARRDVERILHPTGLFILIAGPDGSGKSTLANDLASLPDGLFRRATLFHSRPGLLPRPGALLGRAEGDPTRPHAKQPHGRAISTLLVGYYWVDFLLGSWLRIWPLRLRTGLAVMERGWWDLAVDPRRYRLTVSPRLVRFLGALLPRPDLAFVLGTTPELLVERKAELGGSELDRQTTAWRSMLPRSFPVVHLDASEALPTVQDRAREAILARLESRALSRLGSGWTPLPSRKATRWLLPRGPRRTAVSGLGIYQPVTIAARLGWEGARLLAAAGAFRLFPRAEDPLPEVREALAGHVGPRSTVAVARVTFPGRYVAMIIDERGRCRSVAKIATDSNGVEALDREAAAISFFGKLLPPPLSAPRIIAREPQLLLLEAIPFRPRLAPWRLDEGVAKALGMLFASRGSKEGGYGPAHGDCSPWNLLQTKLGWFLVDWEEASDQEPPFYDLCHYIVEGNTELGRPSWQHIIRGFRRGEGWIGRAIRAYADGAGLDAKDAERFLEEYLLISRSKRSHWPYDGHWIEDRERLLELLGR